MLFVMSQALDKTCHPVFHSVEGLTSKRRVRCVASPDDQTSRSTHVRVDYPWTYLAQRWKQSRQGAKAQARSARVQANQLCTGVCTCAQACIVIGRCKLTFKA